ncbi:MAG: transposase [bacterium]|nr:transposase [bacterium]
MNRLKGEQGKPDIKPNLKTPATISSEQERKHAEREADGNGAGEGFRLDRPSVEKRKEHRIPDEVLEQLTSLRGTRYADEQAFLHDVELLVGAELTGQYQGLLLKYARYRKRRRRSKLPDISIDREEICPVDPASLPADAAKKGYEDTVVQDVIIRTDNVRFHREASYSASLKKTYLGPLPKGYKGEFGPHIKPQILAMKYVNNMSIPTIHECYTTLGIMISITYISDRLTKHIEVFHQEKCEMYQASLECSGYQHIDDTTTRVNGQNHSTHIVCSPCAMLFFTTSRKDRFTILDVLRNFESRRFVVNDETFRLLEPLKVSHKAIARLHEVEQHRHLNEQEMDALMLTLFPAPLKSPRQQAHIREAAAIASYHQQTGHPIVEVLVCDDAPQFKLLTDDLALCWVHDGRHDTRLRPVVPGHQARVEAFLQQYWEYYRALYLYKQTPSAELAHALSVEFDTLFSTTSDYAALDERIAKSRAKKQELLAVLRRPELPLHHNPAEHGARSQKRRDDVSLQTKTPQGTRAKDTMMSIVETCKKLRVSAYHFFFDRITQTFHMPSLADMIRAKAASQPIRDEGT